jgi:hypothetical protein
LAGRISERVATSHATPARLPGNRSWVACRSVLLLGLSLSLVAPLQAQIGLRHATTPTHEILMDYAAAKAVELPAPLRFTSAQRNRLQEGARDEDVPDTRSLNHGYNPMNNGAFPLATMTARAAAAERWDNMTSAFAGGNLEGGDDAGAWHFLGRASHLLQDMTSPLHTFSVGHAGIPLFSESCQFEHYWENQAPRLRALLNNAGGPLHSSILDTNALAKLDPWTRQRLQDRFSQSSPHKDTDDVRGWMEVLAWITYFRATFWGQVQFGDPSWPYLGSSGSATSPTTSATTFSDGIVGAQSNALHTMFNGNVRWRVGSDLDWFYEITDRNGNVFRWMSWTDVDDWSACGRTETGAGGWTPGQKDSSIRVGGSDDDDAGVRITGRFWFDLRELGKNSSGQFNRRCYPHRHPNGEAMTDDLHEYLGQHLLPLTVQYNAGLLGLANRRVTVNTDAALANGFAWGRKDNWGNGPLFSADPGGTNFYFAARSQVSLTAPAMVEAGQPFLRWLKDGAEFPGNSNRTITVNTATNWIPAHGVTYTAEFRRILIESPAIEESCRFLLLLRGHTGEVYLVQSSSDLTNWVNVSSVTNLAGTVPFGEPLSTVATQRFYRALLLP